MALFLRQHILGYHSRTHRHLFTPFLLEFNLPVPPSICLLTNNKQVHPSSEKWEVWLEVHIDNTVLWCAAGRSASPIWFLSDIPLICTTFQFRMNSDWIKFSCHVSSFPTLCPLLPRCISSLTSQNLIALVDQATTVRYLLRKQTWNPNRTGYFSYKIELLLVLKRATETFSNRLTLFDSQTSNREVLFYWQTSSLLPRPSNIYKILSDSWRIRMGNWDGYKRFKMLRSRKYNVV